MTDKEKIKQEIERRIKEGSSKNDISEGALTLDSLLDFIDSLSEEKKSQFPNYESIVDKVFGAGNLESFERSEAERLVLLAKEELLKDLEINKEPASEDLEEAAINAWDEHVGLQLMHIEEAIAFFREAAEWQKQQMMKDAIDATIFYELKGSDGSLFQVKSDRFRMNGVKIGDRIKVVLIKTEQQ